MIRSLAALMLATPLCAQEYIVTDGPLTDGEFYGVVSCAATPGQGCNAPIVRWDQQVVTVAFEPMAPSYPTDLAREFDRLLDISILQINAAAPGLTLRRVAKSQSAHVRLFLQPIRFGDAVRGTGYPEMDGTLIGAALVQVYWDDDLKLTEALIAFAADIPINQAGPIMLEELTQAMGLMTDIRDPYYETRSIFSEDSNSVAKLGVQDRTALRFHYPAQ
ncbi:MAG: hypothetical protein KIH44_001395 [Octadecabacter sp.]|nr:hypothetical protein [Octadecabacter sp.]